MKVSIRYWKSSRFCHFLVNSIHVHAIFVFNCNKLAMYCSWRADANTGSNEWPKNLFDGNQWNWKIKEKTFKSNGNVHQFRSTSCACDAVSLFLTIEMGNLKWKSFQSNIIDFIRLLNELLLIIGRMGMVFFSWGSITVCSAMLLVQWEIVE